MLVRRATALLVFVLYVALPLARFAGDLGHELAHHGNSGHHSHEEIRRGPRPGQLVAEWRAEMHAEDHAHGRPHHHPGDEGSHHHHGDHGHDHHDHHHGDHSHGAWWAWLLHVPALEDHAQPDPNGNGLTSARAVPASLHLEHSLPNLPELRSSTLDDLAFVVVGPSPTLCAGASPPSPPPRHA